MKINLPNQITLARLLLAIVFFIVLAQYSHRDAQPRLLAVGLALFLVAAATDYLDGYYARKHNQVTALGRVLDPFVDKVLVCGAFVFFAGPAFCADGGRNITGLEPWMVVVILGRELLVTALRGVSESQGVAFGAEFVGKAKMWIQSISVAVILLVAATSGTQVLADAPVISRTFAWLTVLVTGASLVTYLLKAKAILTETSRR